MAMAPTELRIGNAQKNLSRRKFMTDICLTNDSAQFNLRGKN
jgi:hypothetical protein